MTWGIAVKLFRPNVWALALVGSMLNFGALAALGGSEGQVALSPVLGTSVGDAAPAASGRLVRDGIAIDFEARPVGGAKNLVEGGNAEVRFKVTDLTSGQPVPGLTPGVWLDLAKNTQGRESEQKQCKDKIALYLKGVVGMQPMVDLNGYYMLVMNKDASITVVDPVVSFGGVTSTYATIVLRKPPMDWTRSTDGKRMFVTMPTAGQVAVVDTEAFRVIADVDAGRNPVRAALQPDGRYLWVGNNGRGEEESGVTVIDTATLKPVLSAATGPGHHEIVFSEDSRWAFVSNRDAGTVTVFDVAALKPAKTIKTGSRPISLGYSSLARTLYVADGAEGTITAIDGEQLAVRSVIKGKPGFGPLRITPDGRFAMALNTLENTVTVIDVAANEVVHTVVVAAEPYQLTFTRAFAYIRGLASERVTMINLGSLGKGKSPTVQSFQAGAMPPKLAGDLPIADGMSAAKADAAMFVVNPTDNTTYFYMEGMNAAMGSYLNRGHAARGVTVVDRSIKEVEPGVFATQVRLPTAGNYDVAFMLDRPQVLHCFSADVKPDLALERKYAGPKATLTVGTPLAVANSRVPVKVRLTEGRESQPRTGVSDVTIRYFRAPSAPARQVVARDMGDGVYEAELELGDTGAYYVHVAVPSLEVRFGDQPFATIRAVASDRDAVARGAAPAAN